MGEKIGKMFDVEGGQVEHFGTIKAYKKWWKIVYADGDKEDMNYRQLATLSTPPNFASLKYANPDQQVKAFLQKSDGAPRLEAVRQPGSNEVVEFKLQQVSWALVSVFLVQDSKSPLQGAYVPADDFCHGMRNLGLSDLLAQHPDVKVSPMDAVRAWISKSA